MSAAPARVEDYASSQNAVVSFAAYRQSRGAPAAILSGEFMSVHLSATETEALKAALQSTIYGDAMADPTREEFDSKLETTVARTDTKFAELIGEIRVISSDLKGEMGKINTRLDGVERSTAGVKGTVVWVALGTIAIVIGVMAFGQQWFGIGMSTRDIVRTTVQEMQIPLPPPNTRK